jgi:hypothetical protein
MSTPNETGEVTPNESQIIKAKTQIIEEPQV